MKRGGGRIARRRRARHARWRPRRLGSRRPADRARRRLLRARGPRRGASPGGPRGRQACARGAPAGGLAVQGARPGGRWSTWIFRPSGGPIGDEALPAGGGARGDGAQPMLVASLDDVLATKLLSLREQELGLRACARALALAARTGRLGLRPGPDRRRRPSRERSSRWWKSWGSCAGRERQASQARPSRDRLGSRRISPRRLERVLNTRPRVPIAEGERRCVQ